MNTDDKLPYTLQKDVDYLYCPVCDKHVACIRTDTGYWEVTCPDCSGECGMCKCHLARYCFGRREEFPPFPSEERDSVSAQ